MGKTTVFGERLCLRIACQLESLHQYGTADLMRLLASDGALPRGLRKVTLHTGDQAVEGVRYELH
jgi:hypothetical protein